MLYVRAVLSGGCVLLFQEVEQVVLFLSSCMHVRVTTPSRCMWSVSICMFLYLPGSGATKGAILASAVKGEQEETDGLSPTKKPKLLSEP